MRKKWTRCLSGATAAQTCGPIHQPATATRSEQKGVKLISVGRASCFVHRWIEARLARKDPFHSSPELPITAEHLGLGAATSVTIVLVLMSVPHPFSLYCPPPTPSRAKMDGRCRKVGHTLSVREFIILNSEKEETFPAAVGGWGGGGSRL